MPDNNADDKGGFKKTLKDWLDEFYDDTSTISTIVRNTNFAGIGLIWIFKNNNLTLPPELVLPLEYIVFSLITDLAQYLWRAINIFIVYRYKEHLLNTGKRPKEDFEDVLMPSYIEIGGWVLFIAKIILTIIAYWHIYQFLLQRVVQH